MILPTADHFSSSASPAPATAPSKKIESRRPRARLSPAENSELTALVVRAQGEDAAAQTALVRQYTRRLSGYVRLIIRQPDAVDDVVQTTFIKMFRRLNRLRDPAAFESWLFRLARNTAVDFIRRQRCRPITVAVDDQLFEVPDPTNAGATSEILDALKTALQQVSPRDRDLLNLYVQGNSYESLARSNGLTLGAVKARLHRIRPFLRTFVGEATETRLPLHRPNNSPVPAHKGQTPIAFNLSSSPRRLQSPPPRWMAAD